MSHREGRSPTFDQSPAAAWRAAIVAGGGLRPLPEHLAGLGFRHALAALETADRSELEKVWHQFAAAAGWDGGIMLAARLSCWVRAVRRGSARRIVTLSAGAEGLSRDECLAVSMIAACQHGDCGALRASGFALMGTGSAMPALEAAGTFAAALSDSGHHLSEASICNVLSFLRPVAARPS
jgi:hypothetical protein